MMGAIKRDSVKLAKFSRLLIVEIFHEAGTV